MIDDRVILEVGASVPVFRRPGPDWFIDPPGQFTGAVLRTEQGYEAWRYPPGSKLGQPLARANSLIEAAAAFGERAYIERPRSTVTQRRRQATRTVCCGASQRCECGQKKFFWEHFELHDLATGEILASSLNRVKS